MKRIGFLNNIEKDEKDGGSSIILKRMKRMGFLNNIEKDEKNK